MTDRDKRADLLKLATRVLSECANNAPFGLNLKRPFGFSGDPAYDVLKIVGVQSSADGYTEEQLEYGGELWEEVGEFIIRTWKEKALGGLTDD